jgi:hypothetical protein
MAFIETPEIRAGKRRLEAHNHATFTAENVRIDRLIAERMEAVGWRSDHSAAPAPKRQQQQPHQQQQPSDNSKKRKIGLDRDHTPNEKPAKRDRDTVRPPVFDQLPFGQWYKACASEKDAKGQQSCWFICNRAGGCLNDAAKCKRSHEFKPKDYADKHWDGELAAPRQRPPERQTCFDQLTDRTRIRHHRDAKRHKRHEAGTC